MNFTEFLIELVLVNWKILFHVLLCVYKWTSSYGRVEFVWMKSFKSVVSEASNSGAHTNVFTSSFRGKFHSSVTDPTMKAALQTLGSEYIQNHNLHNQKISSPSAELTVVHGKPLKANKAYKHNMCVKYGWVCVVWVGLGVV